MRKRLLINEKLTPHELPEHRPEDPVLVNHGAVPTDMNGPSTAHPVMVTGGCSALLPELCIILSRYQD